MYALAEKANPKYRMRRTRGFSRSLIPHTESLGPRRDLSTKRGKTHPFCEPGPSLGEKENARVPVPAP